MELFNIGDQPTVVATFRERQTKVLADPSTIVVKVRKPDGTITDFDETDCVNISVGIWEFPFQSPLDEDGQWTVKFSGTATVIASDEISFGVRCAKIGVS